MPNFQRLWTRFGNLKWSGCCSDWHCWLHHQLEPCSCLRAVLSDSEEGAQIPTAEQSREFCLPLPRESSESTELLWVSGLNGSSSLGLPFQLCFHHILVTGAGSSFALSNLPPFFPFLILLCLTVTHIFCFVVQRSVYLCIFMNINRYNLILENTCCNTHRFPVCACGPWKGHVKDWLQPPAELWADTGREAHV